MGLGTSSSPPSTATIFPIAAPATTPPRSARSASSRRTVEMLTPDFLGCEEDALATVLAERPDVFDHNIETVRRLHARMRGAKASYDKALWLLGGRRRSPTTGC